MPNQHTVWMPVSDLTPDQAIKHLIRTSIPQLQEQIMSLSDSLGRLTTEVQQQMQQTADALANVQVAVDELAVSQEERAALQTALDEANNSLSTAQTAIDAQSDVLASDDPEEAPEEPTDPEVTEPTDPEAPVDPEVPEDTEPAEPTDPEAQG